MEAEQFNVSVRVLAENSSPEMVPEVALKKGLCSEVGAGLGEQTGYVEVPRN